MIEAFHRYFKWNSSQGKKNIVSKVDFVLSSLKEYILKKGREEERVMYSILHESKGERLDVKPSSIISKFPPPTTVALINFVYQ